MNRCLGVRRREAAHGRQARTKIPTVRSIDAAADTVGDPIETSLIRTTPAGRYPPGAPALGRRSSPPRLRLDLPSWPIFATPS